MYYFKYISIIIKIKAIQGISLVVQWLGLCTPNAGDQGSISGQGTRSHTDTKSLHATTKTRCRKIKTWNKIFFKLYGRNQHNINFRPMKKIKPNKVIQMKHQHFLKFSFHF